MTRSSSFAWAAPRIVSLLLLIAPTTWAGEGGRPEVPEDAADGARRGGRDVPVPRRLPHGADRRGAARVRPGRRRVRRGRPALCRRDVGLSSRRPETRQAVRREHARPADRPAQAPDRPRRRRQVRHRGDPGRQAVVADRRRGLEGRGVRRRDAEHLVHQGRRRRRPGRDPRGGLRGLPQVQHPGRDEQPPVGPRPRDLRCGVEQRR